MQSFNIDVVIVTFNRLEKLKKTLNCYDKQTVPFRNIIVVNNHSTDNTMNFLEEWQSKNTPYTKYVLNLEENIGGSGGFYKGQKFAMSLNPDWIYLSDDDAYPDSEILHNFYSFVESHEIGNVSAICGCVYNHLGNIDFYHRCTYNLLKGVFYNRVASTWSQYQLECFEIDLLSYVGSFLNAEALKRQGLVNPNYFIYFDDTEHSIRLKKFGKIICVPSIKIYHDDELQNSSLSLSWKDYYSVRNELHMLIKHHPIAAITWTRKRIKLLKSYLPDKARIYKVAIKDAWFGKLGKHNIYQPGWKSN